MERGRVVEWVSRGGLLPGLVGPADHRRGGDLLAGEYVQRPKEARAGEGFPGPRFSQDSDIRYESVLLFYSMCP